MRISTPTDAARGGSGSPTTPDAFVVEEFVPLSHAPIWHDGQLESRTLMLRVFLAADGRGGYELMPGGLSRIAGENWAPIVSSQRGGGSKDTWVLSDAPPVGAVAVAPHARAGAGRTTSACRAARPSICSGWAATPSEPRTARGCCARCSRGSATRRRPPVVHPSFLRTCVDQNLLGAGDVRDGERRGRDRTRRR